MEQNETIEQTFVVKIKNRYGWGIHEKYLADVILSQIYAATTEKVRDCLSVTVSTGTGGSIEGELL